MRRQGPLMPGRPVLALGPCDRLAAVALVEHAQNPGKVRSVRLAKLLSSARCCPNASESACVVSFLNGGGEHTTVPRRGHKERTLGRHIYLEWRHLARETIGWSQGSAEVPGPGYPSARPVFSALLARSWSKQKCK